MIRRLIDFANQHRLFSQGDRILAAVSGGADSMVMLHLLYEAGVLGGVAHINYRLRGNDSELDEYLVQKVSARLNVPFFLNRLEQGWENGRRESLQMAARELRYKWFEELLEKNKFSVVATAHHLDDQAENILLQVSKGMNFTGFLGIPEKNERIIRPMLFTDRREILNYANANGVEWREDRSNKSDDYQRNFIRNKIIPLLRDINPSFSDSIDQGKWKASGVFELYKNQLAEIRKKLVSTEPDGGIRISLLPIKNFRFRGSVLYHLISEYGFNPVVCSAVADGPELQSGTEFFSATHRLVVDRGQIFLTLRNNDDSGDFPVQISGVGCFTAGNHQLNFSEIAHLSPLAADASVAVLDASKLQFPLEWRKWQPGDSFVPLGMTGHKKVSDLLIDEKIPVSKKDQVTVLLSGNSIVWVVGLRISQEFCLNDATTHAWRIEYASIL